MSGAGIAGTQTRVGPRVAIVGGGLAGLATAVALAEAPCQVELFEARRYLGGRAASFRDPASGELVDHCQHVSLGCCTNWADFCRRLGLDELVTRSKVLHFFGPDGRRCDLAGSRWLPSPLHLARGLLGLRFLCLGDRLAIGRAMLRLARLRNSESLDRMFIGQWLREQGQSVAAIERFWSVVLVSALSETVERASLAAARKVFVDGFLGSRRAYEMSVPGVRLQEFYGRTRAWLEQRGVALHLGAAVERIEEAGSGLRLAIDASRRWADFVVLAVPWTHVAGLLTSSLADRLPWVARLDQIESAPITSVHLWFDRPITSLPHAVLVGRLSQWVFARATSRPTSPDPRPHYYQVVISASHELRGRDRDDVIDEVQRDLAAVWPATNEARLLAARLITQHDAVFSPRPGVDKLRPAQTTDVPGLLVAGDWTQTLWPATMEGAVRSGYLAAEAIHAALDCPRRLLVSDLPRGWLARWLLGKA